MGEDEDGGELRPHEIHHGGTPTEMAVEQKKHVFSYDTLKNS